MKNIPAGNGNTRFYCLCAFSDPNIGKSVYKTDILTLLQICIVCTLYCKCERRLLDHEKSVLVRCRLSFSDILLENIRVGTWVCSYEHVEPLGAIKG